ncbi:MAG: VOC family protein [Chloroflexi bacterium]|nr:VOC family protein [Chloroflexota bacterium]
MVSALKNLVEVVLVVEDTERSMAFYGEVLGLELISPAALPVKFLRIGPAGAGVPQQIVLVPRSMAGGGAATREPARVLHHIGLEVAPADFEPERRRLTSAGFELRTGVHPFMPIEAFYLNDPDGNEIEVATWRG